MSTDSSTTSSVINTLPLHTPSLTVVQFPPSLKLNSTNYLSWKTQIEALLHGLDLYKFIDGSHLPPTPTMDTTGKSIPHADYPAWFRQDRLLFGALVGSLSPTIVPLITNATSSLDAWKILGNTYASPSRGHIKQLQHRLKQSSKHPDQSITDYMQSVKSIVDELSILGKKMDMEDTTDVILTGLDQTSYKPVIDAIHARDTPISFHELHEKLINHELSLVQKSTETTNLHQPTSVFAAHTRPLTKQWPNRHSSQNRTAGILPTPNQVVARPFLGKCQFCFQKGHSLTSCHAFKKQHPQVNLPSLPRQRYNKPQAHMMEVPSTTSSNIVTTGNHNWLFDSGASHHITNDLNAL